MAETARIYEESDEVDKAMEVRLNGSGFIISTEMAILKNTIKDVEKLTDTMADDFVKNIIDYRRNRGEEISSASFYLMCSYDFFERKEPFEPTMQGIRTRVEKGKRLLAAIITNKKLRMKFYNFAIAYQYALPWGGTANHENFVKYMYSRLGISSDRIGTNQLMLRKEIFVNSENVEHLWSLWEKVQQSTYRNLFQSLILMFLRGDLAKILRDTDTGQVDTGYIDKYFSMGSDRRMINEFIRFLKQYPKKDELTNSFSENIQKIGPVFYELVNLFIFDLYNRGELKLADKELKILLLQVRADSFDQEPSYPPIALPILAGAIDDGYYQARLFSKWEVLPEVYEQYLLTRKTVQLLDLQAKSRDFSYEDYVDRFKPDIVGIRTVSISIDEAERLARITKQRLGDKVKIHLGGYHITAMPETTMLKNEGIVDVGIMRAAEETYPYVLAMHVAEKEMSTIPNIIYFQHGHLIRTPPGKGALMKMDDYPSFLDKWDLLPDLDRYAEITEHNIWGTTVSRMALLVTERGCKGRCAFCPIRIMSDGPGIEYLSSDAVIKMMEQYYNRGYRIFNFRDENFTWNRERARKIVRAIKEKGWKISWSCMARADTVDAILLKEMYESGLSNVAFGVESGSQEIVKTMKKKLRLWSVRRANGICRQLGISYKNYYMVGAPGEKWSDVLKSLLFMTDSLVGFKEINKKVLAQITPSPVAYTGFFDAFVLETIQHKDDLERFLRDNLVFSDDALGLITVGYAMPYPGSEWYGLLGKEIWLDSNVWRHGPREGRNLDEYDAPTHTRTMTSRDLSKARALVINFYEALKKKDVASLASILKDVIVQHELFMAFPAQLIEGEKLAYGGIDLTPEMMDWEVSGEANRTFLPIIRPYDEIMRGLYPVIINISSVTDLSVLVGVSRCSL